MLINATRPAEVRAAILENNNLESLEIEVRDARLLKGNIYLGRIANVEGSLNACFVEFGAEKQGFLPLDEIHSTCWHQKPPKDQSGKPNVSQVMKKGQPVLVQVVKDAIGNKGAALTTRISLAGRYIVLMPFDESRGVSRKVSSDSARKKIKEIAGALKVPKDYGFIVRTAGLDRTKTDLNRDVAQLIRTWKTVQRNADKKKSQTRLLHSDGDLVLRMLRDYYASDISQVIIDSEEAYTKALDYFGVVMPRSKQVLTRYLDRIPLFSRYRVEQQIESIFARRADLKSGGYILIDPTEALISVDVNSGRSTKQKSQEDTALHTNLEAAREVARQLRLRDLGGLIVIDFIDMSTKKANKQVEKVLKDSLKSDKARTYVGRISDNGLLEVNRQRLKQALQLQTHRDCPTCDGRGVIPSPEFVAHRVLRSIEAKAANGTFAKVAVSLHPELADHCQNHHRREIMDLEERFGVLVAIEGRPGLHRGEQQMEYEGLGGLPDHERKWVEAQRERLAHERLGEDAQRAAAKEAEDVDAAEAAEIEAELQAELDAAEADGEAKAKSEPAEGEEGEEQPRKRRRRRRRGKRRPEDEGAEAKAEGDEDSASGDDEAQAEGEGDEDDESALSRSQKRRRRRKRKRSPEDGEEGEGSDTTEGEVAAAGEDSEDEDGEEQPRRRRRRRRRRGRGKGEGESAAASENGEAAAPAEAAPADHSGPAPGTVLVAPPSDGLFADQDEVIEAAPDDDEVIEAAPDDDEVIEAAPDDDGVIEAAPDDDEVIEAAPDDDEVVEAAPEDAPTEVEAEVVEAIEVAPEPVEVDESAPALEAAPADEEEDEDTIPPEAPTLEATPEDPPAPA